jgi:prepilin-type N-terminal cleavage/methylation domain-containing protein
MKKISTRSKSGFTLLEVLLAVVILTIASTMIMKGFVAVMIFGSNNRNFSRYGTENYRQAMSDTLASNATASSQIDRMNNLAGGSASVVTATFADGTGATLDNGLPTLVVDVSSYSDAAPALSDGSYALGHVQDTEMETSANNRFAFFYDLADYLGPSASAGGHIIRWGFVFNPAGRMAQTPYYNIPIYVDKNNNGRVGDDDLANASAELVGYGHYGWYCFNANHNPSTETCRSQEFIPAH